MKTLTQYVFENNNSSVNKTVAVFIKNAIGMKAADAEELIKIEDHGSSPQIAEVMINTKSLTIDQANKLYRLAQKYPNFADSNFDTANHVITFMFVDK